MARGRPPKCSRNISGLRNQARKPAETDIPILNSGTDSLTPVAADDTGINSDGFDSEVELKWDKMKSRTDEEEESLYQELGHDTEVEEGLDFEIFEDEELEDRLAIFVRERSNPDDRDWMPHEPQNKKRKIGEI